MSHPIVAAAVSTARLVQRVGARLDALSLDLARDAGHVARDAQALATLTKDQLDRAAAIYRATPRAAKLAQTAAAILARHRWLRLAAAARGDEALRDEDQRDLARRAAQAMAQLRGGVAKIGQLASCRPDLVGPIWAAELATLQSEVPPIDAALVRARVAEELGRPLDEIFATFDDEPLAAASLAQVHGATLLDGTAVAVKVQVPGVEAIIDADIAALRAVAAAVKDVPGLDLATLADELGRALLLELDYVAEAAALRAFETTAIVPRPIAEASSARVLTMTRIDGERLTVALDRMAPAERDALLAQLVDEVAGQILARGHVHADPHPGNFLVAPGGRLALLDFGCTLELSREERAAYARLVLAMARDDRAAAAAELAALGFRADDPDRLAALAASIVGALRPDALAGDVDWSSAFAAQVAQAKQLGGLAIPRSFVLLGRVLATVAGLLATYRPRIPLFAIIAKHLAAAASTPTPAP